MAVELAIKARTEDCTGANLHAPRVLRRAGEQLSAIRGIKSPGNKK